MDYGKYIIATYGCGEIAIMFDSLLSHDSVASGFTIVSAGFFLVNSCSASNDLLDIEVSCFGKSVSLGVDARKEDNVLIKRVLRKDWKVGC